MKSYAAIAAAFAAVAILLIVPVSETDAVYSNISGESIIGISDEEDYTITYNNTDYNDRQDVSVSVSYKAKLVDSSGTTVSSGVSPSSGTMTNGESETLTVTAPKEAGNLRLVVTYDVEISYTEDGETKEVPSEDLAREDSFDIRVVVPVSMSVTLTNESDVDLSGYGVYFAVRENGEWNTIEDSYQTIDLAKAGSASVTYKWVAAPAEGQYAFKVIPADSGNLVSISGLDEEHVFYIGDSDYTMWTILLAFVVVLLIIIMIWVYRKPVKNFGKPKSRR